MVNVSPLSQLWVSVVIAAWFSAAMAVAAGLDSGYDAVQTAAVLHKMHPLHTNGGWIRIRGLENCAVGPQNEGEVLRTRAALVNLRGEGARVVAIVRWPTLSWPKGARQPAREGRLPIQLNEAFDRCRLLAETFGDVVDMWEIDNEPDISFVQENPETYAAFLKACYLGFAQGKAENLKAEKLKSDEPVHTGEVRSQPSARYSLPATRYSSKVLMAPLALPPGPYLEAFVANGGLSYTDGFNYHYYGYAEDFTGVYRQFEKAVRELALGNAETLKAEKLKPNQSASASGQPMREEAGQTGLGEASYNEERGQRTEDGGQRMDDGRRRSEGGPTSVSVFRTKFFPSAQGWKGTVVAKFDHASSEVKTEIGQVLMRPRAAEEPPLKQQGRWLVTDGVTVEEIPGGWRFTVEKWPDGPLRAPMAELPLPKGWPLEGKAERLTEREARRWPERSVGPSEARVTDAGVPFGPARAQTLTEAGGRTRPNAETLKTETLKTGLGEAGGRRTDGGGQRTDDRGQRTDAGIVTVAGEAHSLGARSHENAPPVGHLSSVVRRRDRLPPEQVALRESLISYEYRIVKNPAVTTVKASDAIDPERQRRQVWNVSSLPAYAEPVRQVEGHDEPEVETATEERPTSNTQHPTSSAGQYEAPASGQPTSGRKAENGGQRTEDRGRRTEDRGQRTTTPHARRGAETPPYSSTQLRQLPVFLTEYGYASLDKVTRNMAEGRERQRLWFSDVREQIRALGIEGAMAFVLKPYLEGDLLEFGLMMETDVQTLKSGKSEKLKSGQTEPVRQAQGHAARETDDGKPTGGDGPRRVGEYYASPALEEMLDHAEEPITPKRWTVETPPPSPIVIDFIAGKGLGQAKSYGGYFLEGEYGRATPGEGDLVIYNFGEEPLTGELRIEGDAWELKQEEGSTTSNTERLTLQPMERRVVPVRIRPKIDRFAACPVSARFVEMVDAAAQADAPASGQPTAGKRDDPHAENLEAEKLKSGKAEGGERQALPEPPKPPFNMFECYFRTENGNLYQTWPRLLPKQSWQRYMEPVENFTMAFYGRANLPWRFTENRPTSLVFVFHPDEFPVTYEVRGATMVRFERPKAETLKR